MNKNNKEAPCVIDAPPLEYYENDDWIIEFNRDFKWYKRKHRAKKILCDVGIGVLHITIIFVSVFLLLL